MRPGVLHRRRQRDRRFLDQRPARDIDLRKAKQTLDLIAGQLDSLADSLRAMLVFAPHVGGVDVPDVMADAVAAHALRARLRSPLLVLGAWQPREMRWLVGEAALVVSTRYHPLVFATAAGTPATCRPPSPTTMSSGDASSM